MTIFVFSMIVIGIFLYNRYTPVSGINHVDQKEIKNNVTFIDIRDFNESYHAPIPGAVNIPVGYLKRYYQGIPGNDLYVIASGKLERNIGIRFLRKKGFHIIGYSIPRDEKIVFNRKNSMSLENNK